MKALLILAAGALVLPMQGALACPPLPPGQSPLTEEQFLERSMPGVTDIVYGVVTSNGEPGKPQKFKIVHVYRGTLHAGETISAVPGWGHPEPMCVGMMAPAYPKPKGSYGVVAFREGRATLNFISPENVQRMIVRGWIESARASRPRR